MKKVCSLCLAVVFLFGLALPFFVLAGPQTTCHLKDVGITITMPQNSEVITRENIKFKKPFIETAYDMTVEKFFKMMKKTNGYLICWDDVHFCQVYVNMKISKEEDYNLHTDSELLSMVFLNFNKDNENTEELEWVVSEIYTAGNCKFIKTYYTDYREYADYIAEYIVEYTTVINGKQIDIIFFPYDYMFVKPFSHPFGRPLNDEWEQYMCSIVDTIVFDQEPVQPEIDFGKAKEPFVYSNDAGGMQFTVPAGWVKTDTYKNNKDVQLSFAHVEDPDCEIIFRGIDLWELMSELEKKDKTREQINFNGIRTDQLASLLEMDERFMSKTKYKNNKYFECEYVYLDTFMGQEVPQWRYNCIWVHNGYAYIFDFTGHRISRYFPGFKSVLSNAVLPGLVYPTEKPAVKEPNDVPVECPKESDQSEVTDEPKKIEPIDRRLYLILGLFVIFCLYPLPIVLYRMWIKKGPVSRKKAVSIALFYGLLGLACMSPVVYYYEWIAAVAGLPLICWSILHYLVLTAPNATLMPASACKKKVPADEEGVTCQTVPGTEKMCDEEGVVAGTNVIPNKTLFETDGSTVVDILEEHPEIVSAVEGEPHREPVGIADDIDMDALGEEFPAMAQEKETDVPTQEESENELSENGGGKTVLTQTESIDGEGKTEA